MELGEAPPSLSGASAERRWHRHQVAARRRKEPNRVDRWREGEEGRSSIVGCSRERYEGPRDFLNLNAYSKNQV